MLLKHWLGHLPDGYLCVDLALPQRRSDRDAMVPVADEVHFANLDQLDRRQAATTQVGLGDAQPAILSLRFEQMKRAVEIFTAPFAAADLTDRHDLCSSGVAITNATGGSNRREVEQLILLAAELRPELASPAGAAGGSVQ